MTLSGKAQNVAPLDLSDPDVAAIVRIAADFSEAVEQGDLARLLSFYSPEIVKSAPGQPPQRGIGAVTESWKKTLSVYRCRLEVQIDEVKILGGTGYDSGVFKLTLIPKAGGETVESSGRVFEVVRKEQGSWKSLRVVSMSRH